MKQQEAVLTTLLNRPSKNIEMPFNKLSSRPSGSVEKEEEKERILDKIQESAPSRTVNIGPESSAVEAVLGGSCKDSAKHQEAVLAVLLNRPSKNVEKDKEKERVFDELRCLPSESIKKDEEKERLFDKMLYLPSESVEKDEEKERLINEIQKSATTETLDINS